MARACRQKAVLAFAAGLGLILFGRHIALAAAGQQSVVGSLSGRVVDARTLDGISGATVTLSGGASRQTQRTGRGGFYLFTRVPSGTYFVSVTAATYLPSSLGSRFARDTAVAVSLAAPAILSDLDVWMWQAAVASGRVIGEDDSPVVGVSVRALAVIGEQHDSRLLEVGQDITDDRGQFRVVLAPGRYLFYVPSSSQQASRSRSELDSELFATTYYPAATAVASAELVSLEPGQDYATTDIHVTSVDTVSVSGRVVLDDVDEAYVGQVRLRSVVDRQQQGVPDVARAQLDALGNFSFSTVAPGAYRISFLARQHVTGVPIIREQGDNRLSVSNHEMGGSVPPVPAVPTWSAEWPLVVSAESVENALIVPKPAAVVKGHFSFVGGPPPSAQVLRSSMVWLLSESDFGAPSIAGRIEADGRFRTYGVPPGRYVLRYALASKGWFMRSLRVDGDDVPDLLVRVGDDDLDGVVVTLANAGVVVGGTVRTVRRRPARYATVVIFPVDRALWPSLGWRPSPLAQRIRADQNGSYRTDVMLPRRVYVAAIDGPMAEAWTTPEYLAQLVGRSEEVDLRLLSATTLDLVAR